MAEDFGQTAFFWFDGESLLRVRATKDAALPNSGPELPPMAEGRVMMVGQDYYRKAGYLKGREVGNELDTRTWREPRNVCSAAYLPEEWCLYTLAWISPTQAALHWQLRPRSQSRVLEALHGYC